MCIRDRYECAAEPVLKLSKFTQLDKPTIHEALFNVRARIDECRDDEFTMYSDISNSELSDLSKRVKSEKVITTYDYDLEERGDTEHRMPECIEKFRYLFADDLELRCKLKYKPNAALLATNDVAQLPRDIAMGCLLNPMYGGKLCVFFLVRFDPKSHFHLSLLFCHREKPNCCSWNNDRPTVHQC